MLSMVASPTMSFSRIVVGLAALDPPYRCVLNANEL